MAGSEDLESLSDQWGKAVAANDWESSFDISVKGYRAAITAKDHVFLMMFLGFVRIASERLFEKFSKHGKEKEPDAYTCSFCAKSGKDLSIVAGATAAICAECAKWANSSLNDKKTI
ncbi:MAG: ClpX C4-type zinc finger protein [bacterium]|nr:ClpX C4-type zinc finger protein [bacterium]